MILENRMIADSKKFDWTLFFYLFADRNQLSSFPNLSLTAPHKGNAVITNVDIPLS